MFSPPANTEDAEQKETRKRHREEAEQQSEEDYRATMVCHSSRCSSTLNLSGLSMAEVKHEEHDISSKSTPLDEAGTADRQTADRRPQTTDCRPTNDFAANSAACPPVDSTSEQAALQQQSSLASRLLAYSFTTGLARAGVSMVLGNELSDLRYGIGLISKAAAMGSDFAAYNLGLWHDEGAYGLPHDAAEAKYWSRYEKAGSDACGCKTLAPQHVARAASRAREIETEIDDWAQAEAAATAAVEEALGPLAAKGAAATDTDMGPTRESLVAMAVPSP